MHMELDAYGLKMKIVRACDSIILEIPILTVVQSSNMSCSSQNKDLKS